MPLDPQVAAILAGIRPGSPEYWQMTPEEARRWDARKSRILDIAPAPVCKVEDRTIATDAAQVPVRIYTPREPGKAVGDGNAHEKAAGERGARENENRSEIGTDADEDGKAEAFPVLVWLHGGGHVVGSIDTYDAICRQLALQADCLVVSVGYRLAPEHKFPAGVDDSFAALSWVLEYAPEIGGDPKRVAIGGDSAGANLAAVCAILARDARDARLASGARGDGQASPVDLPEVVFQLLVYPRTAPIEDSASHEQFAERHLLTRKIILWFHDHYRASDADRNDFRYSPLIAPDLSRLPPALVIVGEFDPLKDDGIAYALRLAREGNTVDLAHYAGMVHPFFSMGGAVEAGKRALSQSAAMLRLAFAPKPNVGIRLSDDRQSR